MDMQSQLHANEILVFFWSAKCYENLVHHGSATDIAPFTHQSPADTLLSLPALPSVFPLCNIEYTSIETRLRCCAVQPLDAGDLVSDHQYQSVFGKHCAHPEAPCLPKIQMYGRFPVACLLMHLPLLIQYNEGPIDTVNFKMLLSAWAAAVQ